MFQYVLLQVFPTRYLRCPSAVTVGVLKKFLVMKFTIPPTHQVIVILWINIIILIIIIIIMLMMIIVVIIIISDNVALLIVVIITGSRITCWFNERNPRRRHYFHTVIRLRHKTFIITFPYLGNHLQHQRKRSNMLYIMHTVMHWFYTVIQTGFIITIISLCPCYMQSSCRHTAFCVQEISQTPVSLCSSIQEHTVYVYACAKMNAYACAKMNCVCLC